MRRKLSLLLVASLLVVSATGCQQQKTVEQTPVKEYQIVEKEAIETEATTEGTTEICMEPETEELTEPKTEEEKELTLSELLPEMKEAQSAVKNEKIKMHFITDFTMSQPTEETDTPEESESVGTEECDDDGAEAGFFDMQNYHMLTEYTTESSLSETGEMHIISQETMDTAFMAADEKEEFYVVKDGDKWYEYSYKDNGGTSLFGMSLSENGDSAETQWTYKEITQPDDVLGDSQKEIDKIISYLEEKKDSAQLEVESTGEEKVYLISTEGRLTSLLNVEEEELDLAPDTVGKIKIYVNYKTKLINSFIIDIKDAFGEQLAEEVESQGENVTLSIESCEITKEFSEINEIGQITVPEDVKSKVVLEQEEATDWESLLEDASEAVDNN